MAVVEVDLKDHRTGTGAAWVLIVGLLAAVCAVDVVTHISLAAGMLYVPVVLLASLVTTPRWVVLSASAAVLLTVGGAFFSPRIDSELSYVVGNRAIACGAIVACGWFGAAMLGTREQLERSNRSLRAAQARVDEQTRLLEIAGGVGRFGGWSVDVATSQMRLSDEVARIHGVEPGANHPMTDGSSNLVPEDQDRMREVFYRCVSHGTPFDIEVQLVRRTDDELRWVNVIGRAERDDTGAVSFVHGAMQDITDRIEAQLDAESNRRRLEAMTDAMPFVIWAADPAGHIDYLSEEFWRLTGVLRNDALGEAWLAVVHPEDRERTVQSWADALRTGAPYRVEFRARHARDGYRWHLTQAVPERDPSGAVLRWWGTSLDIHDRRVLEEQANNLADRLHQTLESIGDAVLALDPDWRVTFLNSEAERLLQHTREELLGRDIWTVFPDAVGSDFQLGYQRAVAERRPVRFAAPFEPLGLQAEVSAYPHEDGLTIYFRDVSQQRRLAPAPLERPLRE